MCTLYERISALCKERGVAVSRMCLDLGLSKSTMSDMKSGRKKGLSTTNAQKIASYLNVPVEYLLSGEVPAGFSTDYEENPHELELRDTFDALEIDDQIYVKNWVNSFAKDPQRAKKSPAEPQLSEGEQMLINLFRQVPADQQELVLQMIRAALGKM